jgi:transposase InsO family protein
LGKGDTREMNYGFISSQKTEFGVSRLCDHFNIPRSSYYSWLQFESARIDKEKADNELKATILDVYNSSRQNYGCPKIHAKLRNNGIHITRKKIAKLMVEMGIKGRCNRRKKFKTTIKDKNAKLSQDLLNRNFKADEPLKSLVTDITVIETKEGPLYLSAALDLCTKKVSCWSMDTNMKSSLVENTLKEFKRKHPDLDEVIFHSDHGSQYTSHKVRQLLKSYNMLQSMGTVGDSYDNSPIENLWSLLKRETDYQEVFETIKEARMAVFSWLNWYNNKP